MSSHSLNALKRWSCVDAELPSVDSVKALHVYDFDNTLFASPLPNKQVWHGGTIGMLQSQATFANGGWWHDSNVLKATGDGIDTEEQRAWQGWWNESVVNLVRLSMQQTDALTVLLTGRAERGFADVIERMVKSKKLHFHLIVLRPEMGPANQRFQDTMNFKQIFLRDLIDTYSAADEIRLYEDRVKHVTKFREFFQSIRTSLLSSPNPPRKPIKGEVIEVVEQAQSLEPLTEIAQIQKMLNSHNTAFAAGTLPRNAVPYEIKRLVLYTGYLIKIADTARLLALADLANEAENRNYHAMANNVMITPRPCPQHILSKVGGLGRKFRWKAVSLGSFDNKVWAMRVEPVSPTEAYYSENPVPLVVLATKNSGKPIEANRIVNWKPLKADEAFEFDTEVGEKVLLRIEEERPKQNASGNPNEQSMNANGKRNRLTDDDFPPLGASQISGGRAQQNQNQQGSRRDFSGGRHQGKNRGGQGSGQGRGGGANRGRGQGQQRGRGGNSGSGGAGGGGRGRGNYSYRSLDEQRGKENSFHFGGDGANDGGLTY